MIDLLEIEVEIAKISNYQGSALSGACVPCKTCVWAEKCAEIAAKTSSLEKGLARDCYHICFPKSCCAGRHAQLVC